MSKIIGFFCVMAIAVYFFCVMAIAVYAAYLSIVGLIIAFKASIIVGIGALVIEPLPIIFGIIYKYWDKNIPEMTSVWLNLPF